MQSRARTKTIDRLEEVHGYWIDPDNREMWIHGVDSSPGGYEPGVDYMMATKVIKNLHILRHESVEAPITIHLHTCGGDVQEGLAIYDTIKTMPYHVTMISYTHARSMSSYILQAADTRILLPSSHFMFHWGTIGLEDVANSVYSQVEFYKRSEEMLMDIYVERAKNGKKFKNWSSSKIKTYLENSMNRKGDVYLFSHEAVEWGFADSILEDWSFMG